MDKPPDMYRLVFIAVVVLLVYLFFHRRRMQMNTVLTNGVEIPDIFPHGPDVKGRGVRNNLHIVKEDLIVRGYRLWLELEFRGTEFGRDGVGGHLKRPVSFSRHRPFSVVLVRYHEKSVRGNPEFP